MRPSFVGNVVFSRSSSFPVETKEMPKMFMRRYLNINIQTQGQSSSLGKVGNFLGPPTKRAPNAYSYTMMFRYKTYKMTLLRTSIYSQITHKMQHQC